MFSLPLIAETQFAALISGSLNSSYEQMTPSGVITGQYNVSPAFTIQPYVFPAVFVRASNFKSIDPFTHVFHGQIEVCIYSQIDDDPLVMLTHDGIVQQVYSILADEATIQAGVNGANFQLFGIVPSDYHHELISKEHERALMTSLTFEIDCQNLGLS